MLNVADLSITALDTIKAYGFDNEPRFILDELQNAKIAHTQEKQDSTGKGGRKINSLKKNKAVTVSGTNGIVSSGLLEAQTGGKFVEEEAAPVDWTDYLTIESNAATTSYKAVGTSGAEITALYIRDQYGVCETKLEQAAAVADNKFTYDPTTKALAFKSGEYADGTEIVVFYTRKVAAHVLENPSDQYSEKLKVFIDFTAEDSCANQYHGQFYIPKADFAGNFDLDMGDNQTVQAFEFESLAGGTCGVNSTGAFWTYTIFGVNEADAT